MIYLAPSILAADFNSLGEAIHTVDAAGAAYIHLDVMDGRFVPSISFGMPVIESLRKTTKRIFDVHMMVEEPGRYVEAICRSGADIISVHAEACTHLDRTIHQIKETGCRAGVVLNPATSLSALDYILDEVDMVLLMTVNPGFGGQQFIPYMRTKIRSLHSLISSRGLNIDIEVDGGITLDNVESIIQAGANVIVAGSSVFRGDASANTQAFLEIFEGKLDN